MFNWQPGYYLVGPGGEPVGPYDTQAEAIDAFARFRPYPGGDEVRVFQVNDITVLTAVMGALRK